MCACPCPGSGPSLQGGGRACPCKLHPVGLAHDQREGGGAPPTQKWEEVHFLFYVPRYSEASGLCFLLAKN